MGNRYNQHIHHQGPHLQHKGTFLPMLCSRPAIKDVTLPKWEDRSASFSDDPLSPKIGCMGQVKRNNKIVGFPTPHKLAITAKSNNRPVKYSKLKKIFSGKNLTNSPTVTTTTTTAASCRRREVIKNDARGRKIGVGKENSISVSIEDMDPPLPVIKKVHKPADGAEADSLWKRRSGGVALKGLQLQQVQFNGHHLEPTTV